MAFKTLEPIRPGPTAVVPRPRSPLRSTSFPNRRKGFRPRSSPHTLEPSAAGEPYRFEPAPQGLRPIREPADLREIRSSHGVRAASGRRSGASRCSTPSGTGIPDGAEGFQGLLAPSERTSRLPVPYAPSVSPDYQRASSSGSILVVVRLACPTEGKHSPARKCSQSCIFMDKGYPHPMWKTR